MDSLNLLSSAISFPDQCEQVISDFPKIHFPSAFSKVQNVVVSGMGGSALGGRFINSLEKQILKVPVVVSTEYHLPNFVNSQSLVIVSSYSGNTAETLTSYVEARSRNAQIFILTTGGKLAEIAQKENFPHYIFDPKFNPSSQPRMGLGYAITSLLVLLNATHLISFSENLKDLPAYLRERQKHLSLYESIAGELSGKIPVLVASEHLSGAAHAFKNQLNENAKNFSVLFTIPELNHHLMEGLTYPASNVDNLHFLFLNSHHYHSELKKRYQITKEILHRKKISSSEITFSAPNKVYEAMETVQAGAFMSIYLSQSNGVDPGPIPWVDYFKDQITKV